MNNFKKLLFLLLLVPHIVNAAVTAKVDNSTVELGEMVTYSLTVSGNNIKRPNIQRLCDTDLISTSAQTTMQIVNGDVSKNYTLNYQFIPQKSCKIEPIKVEVGGKTEMSNPVEVKVTPVIAANDSDFILALSSDKKELFVGEAFDVVLTFKQKSDAGAVDSEFTPPELKGFWVKNESKPQSSQDGKYTVTKVVYTVTPQRAGELKISKAKMRIASRDAKAQSWGSWIPTIKWKTYFSNELNFNVKPLPSGMNLIGDFSIKATADKISVKANEAVNVMIEVQGSGNIEDIKSFKPTIEDVGVFDEKIVIDGTKLSQKIAFVAEQDFVIPPFSLKFFDSKTKEMKSISSKDIKIDVTNEKKEELVVKKSGKDDTEIENLASDESNKLYYVLIFIFGFATGILTLFFIKKVKFKNGKKDDFAKNPKNVLMKLLPFKDDLEVKEIIEKLEKNIYSNQDIKLDEKVINKIKKRYQIY